MPRSIQPSLTGGEIAPELHTRVDLQRYQNSLALCKNFFVVPQGGVVNRPGFEYIGETLDHTKKSRLIPFQFNTEQTYILVFTENSMRVIYDGGYALEGATSITGVTAANPTTLTITGHPYTTGDYVYVTGTGVAALDNKFHLVGTTTANTIELPVDGTGWSSGGTAARLFDLPTSYAESELFDLKFVQSADVLTVTHPNHAQAKITRTGHAAWTLTNYVFGYTTTTPTGLAVVEGGTGSAGTSKSYSYKVSAVYNGEESDVSAAVNVTTTSYSLSTTRYADLSWTQVTPADYYVVYKEQSYTAGIYGFIGEADQDASPTFRDYNFGPDMFQTPPLNNSIFGGAGDYPNCVTYHQQRLFFAGTNNQPQTVWGSQSSRFENFNYSRPLRSDDSVEFTINSRQVNAIRHMVSIDDLILFTASGVWRISGSEEDGSVLTPANINPRKQGGYGCSNVPPITIGETALYIQEGGKKVRDLAYSFEPDAYTGSDLTVMANHLLEDATIIDWCYADQPNQIVWAVRSDGAMLSLSYLKEHSVWGWCQHDTDGQFEAVASIKEGTEDVVYAVVKRTVNGSEKRYVERMHTRYFATIDDAFFVDSGLTFQGDIDNIIGATQANPVVITTSAAHGRSNGDVVWLRSLGGMTELNNQQFKVANVTSTTFEITDLDGNNIDGTAYTVYTSGGTADYASKNITGLDHLEGKTLVGLADGNVVENLLVTGGAVTLPDFAHIAHLGLPYNSDIETLSVNYQGETLQTRKVAIARVGVAVKKTRGLRAGINSDKLYELKERTVSDGYGGINAKTKTQLFELGGDWVDQGKVFVRQSYPLPATILAFIPELVTGI